MYRSPLTLWPLALLATACSIDPIDLEGRACPCAEGFVCDPGTNTCFEGELPPVGDPDAAIRPTNFRTTWTTSNCILWNWTIGKNDNVELFAEYRVDVTLDDGSIVTFAPTLEGASGPEYINQELGQYTVRRAMGAIELSYTITDLHQPSTEYEAQLAAIDVEGREWRSQPALGTTTAHPGNALVVFSESDVGDTSTPADFVRAMGIGHDGDFAYEWTNDNCPPSEGRCFEVLTRSGLAVDTAAISKESFDTSAFLEFAFASPDSTPSHFSEVGLVCNLGARSVYSPIALRSDGAYRVLQVPLRRFQNENVPSNYSDFTSPCTAFTIGGLWETGATIRIDEIRLRY